MEIRVSEIFRDPPEIETERLVLRRMRVADAKDVFDYASKEETSRYLLWGPHQDIHYTEKYLKTIENLYKKGEFFDWAVELKREGKMIGTGGFTSVDQSNRAAEIGYVLHPDYWSKGYGTEIAEELLAFGFCVLDMNRIQARYMTGNERSRHVMEKCGMTFEGVARNLLFVKGKYRDIGCYALLKEEYFRNHVAKTYYFKTDAHWYDRLW